MGPLHNLRFIEIGALGPGPFCGMMLADMGADVIAIHRPGHTRIPGPMGYADRGKRSVTLDLKQARDVERLLKLCEHADGLFEGFRPGVMERLGVGPENCFKHNASLAYGRISGYGQDGPMAQKAGHDLTYLASSGVLDLSRDQEGRPVPPANIVADYGGGALYMAFGLLCAMLSAKSTGKGQVIDLGLSEGAASLASFFFNNDQTLRTILLGANPSYNIYTCKDGKHIAVACLEPAFYSIFVRTLNLDNDALFANQMDQDKWPAMRAALENRFLLKTRDEWTAVFSDVDCCVVPVLGLSETPENAHMKARQNFIQVGPYTMPRPTPRFSLTEPKAGSLSEVGAYTDAVFKEFGL